MTGFRENQENLFELIHRVLGDHLPSEPLEAVYLFDLSSPNKSSILERAIKLYQQGRVRKLVLNNEGDLDGSISYQQCAEELIARGVSKSDLLAFKPAPEFRGPTGRYNASSQGEGFVRFIKESGYRSVGCIAPTFHLVRAFVAVVSGLAHNNLQNTVRAYAIPGESQSWDEEIVHFQGAIKGPRKNLLKDELARLASYSARGDQVSGEVVLNYLNQREGGNRADVLR